MTAKPKAQIMRELSSQRKKAGLVRVYKCIWVSKRHEAKSKRAFEAAVESLEAQGVTVQHKVKK